MASASSAESLPIPHVAPTRWNFALKESELEQLTKEACTTALSSASAYEHDKVTTWNSDIIHHILTSLTSQLPPTSKPRYKFNVTSTILQHDSLAKTHPPSSTSPTDAQFAQNGGRGMHSASGAYWDASTDGMWSYKVDGEGKRGFDCIVSVLWVQMAAGAGGAGSVGGGGAVAGVGSEHAH
ncbi:MAG: hypothetical protein MMC23_000660 [Stictis urceolatum]|nr:hypothetical protein [Stictis urceolata]